MGPRQTSNSLFAGTQCDLELPALTHLSSVGIAGVPPPCPTLEKDGFPFFFVVVFNLDRHGK